MKDHYTVSQAAKLLGVTGRRIHYIIAEGKLPGASKIDDTPTSPILIPRKSVEDLIKERTKKERTQSRD